MAKKTKPNKPYADFPLFAHANGQWCKKIRGKLHYFGTDAKAALAKYTAERDDLQAGRTPKTPSNGITVRALCNQFLTAKRNLQASGELTSRTWRDYYNTCEIFIELIGKERRVSELAAEDFERLRASLSKGRGPVALGNQVRRIRIVLKYAFDFKLVDKPVDIGPAFKQPNRTAMRKAKQARGVKLIAADELRKILDAAKQPLRAMILLAMNAGYGQTDIASLPQKAINLAGGWVTFPRPKTAVERRCPLWPETVAALREAIADRPDAKDAADAGLAFITKYGKRWVRAKDNGEEAATFIDGIGQEFRKLLISLGLKRTGSFYNLRHTFRTVADGSKDQPAIDLIMGHLSEGMAVHYRESIADERLKVVVDHVHDWLWPKSS